MGGKWAIVLAAGKGTRMQSERPKVVHALAGRPLIAYPIAAAHEAGVDTIVVVTGHGGDEVRDAALRWAPGELQLEFVHQPEQRGTGHAVQCCLPLVPVDDTAVFLLSGDVPLLRARSLGLLHKAWRESDAGLAVATFRPRDPQGYGRILRGVDGSIRGIVEDRDCDEQQKAIDECNSGTYCVHAAALHDVLPSIDARNAQGELYLTDIVERLAARGRVTGLEIEPIEAAGVNTPEQLAALAVHATDLQHLARNPI